MFKKPLLLKILAGLASLLIIALSITVVILLKDSNSQSTPSKTNVDQNSAQMQEDSPKAGFSRYRNTNSGYSFDYPQEWGSVSVAKHERNLDKSEPLQTTFISFSQNEKFLIKISPINWSFNSGEGEFDLPVTDEVFNQPLDNTTELDLLSLNNAYLRMGYSGLSGTVYLKGAKKISLAKLNANYVEFVWQDVSEECAEPANPDTGVRKPNLSCYGQDLIDQTKDVIQSFKAI